MTKQNSEAMMMQFQKRFSQCDKICAQTNKSGIVGTLEEDFQFSYCSYNTNFFKARVRVERLSGYPDYVPVILAEELLKQVDLPVRIKIWGEFRSFNKAGEDGKRHLELFLLGKQVEYDSTEADINIVYLKGNLCKEPFYRKTHLLKRDVTDLILAVNINRNSVYIPCVTWGEDALNSTILKVGDCMNVWGRIQSHQYYKHEMLKEAYELHLFWI